MGLVLNNIRIDYPNERRDICSLWEEALFPPHHCCPMNPFPSSLSEITILKGLIMPPKLKTLTVCQQQGNIFDII